LGCPTFAGAVGYRLNDRNRGEILELETLGLDLSVDPPPDLVIETEVSRSVLRRLRIYAALGTREIWRWRKSGLTAYSLSEDCRSES
jgi:Uma2 family endonuclease